MDDFGIALGGDFVLGHARATSGAPRHDVFAFIEPTVVVASLEEGPDGVVVLVRFGVVRIVPLHEVAKALGLTGDDVREVVDTGFALGDEFVDTVCFDLVLRFEPFFFFDLDFDPQSLSVVSVLKPLAITLHVSETQEEVFVGSPPRVVDAHGVVCGYRAVDEGVVLLSVVVASEVAVDDGLTVGVGRVPPLEPLGFDLDKVDLGFR